MRLLVVGLLLAVASPACAQTEDAQHLLDEGRRLYADLEYQDAEQTLTRALSIDGLPDAFRIELLETLGFVEVVLEREDAARQAFERIFAIDPYFVVREPSGSPRVATLVEQVRARVVSDAAIDPEVELRVDLPRAARRDGATEVRVSVSSDAITSVVLDVRGDHDVAFRPLDGTGRGGQFVVSIPAMADSEELELYVEARDARGRLVTRSGSPLSPLRLPVSGTASAGGGGGGGSILEEWWLWTVIGVVVVGAAVGIGVGVSVTGEAQAPAGTLPPGRVVLP
jgi:tetratricopeptide (TPR) repeat protein